MTAPLIAIAGYRLAPGRVTHWPWGGYAVPEGYVNAVVRAGGMPAIVPPTVEEGRPEDLLARFDGVIVCGGGDIEPARYGQEPTEHLYSLDPIRDAAEIRLIRAQAASCIPMLAICRGLQVVNVAAGGTLHQHLPDAPGIGRHGIPPGAEGVLHEITVAEGSLLAQAAGGVTSMKGESHHHQGIDRLGDGLIPVGWTDDGLVEAVERSDGPWMVAVQWHPEETAAEDRAQQALFDTLVARARERHGSA